MAKQGYKRISFSERRIIEKILSDGGSVTQIAKTLNRPYQTIYRELKRCKFCDYNANCAQQDRKKHDENVGREAKLKLDEKLAIYISKLILEEFLSPVEIIKKLQLENYPNAPTSKATIYSAIYAGLIPDVTRETLLMKRKKTHMFSNGLIKIPRWVCEKLKIKDGEELYVDVENDRMVVWKLTK